MARANSPPTIEEVKEKALPVLRRHRATRAGLFGSLARGELRRRSDIDNLVELGRDLTLLAAIGVQQELEDALGRSVDVVEYKAIKAPTRERILAEEVRII